MRTKRITVEIPEQIYEDLQHIAEASGWSLDKVLLQTIKSGLPPSLAKVPQAFHEELLALNALNDMDLMHVADGHGPAPTRQDAVHTRADFLTLRRTYALSLLRWRGHPVPGGYDAYIP
jgi:hypothetical protein